MKESKLLSVLLSLTLGLFWLTCAIAVPILCRPYYYWQAKLLGLSEKTGFTTETIHTAYNEVMDYLVYGGEFGTGTLRWSESGMSHFADCRGLFRLDFIVLEASLAVLTVLAILYLMKKIRFYHFRGFPPAMWTAMTTTIFFALLGLWAVIDFNSIFTVFHAVCFPGKTNWIFNYRTDQIILILPEEFWARTGALVLIITLGGMWITALISKYKKGR